MKTNKKMDKILNNYFNTSVEVSLDQIFDKSIDKSIVEPKFKFINECIIIDNEDRIKEENLDWKIILNNYGNKTRFEASVNDVRINDYISDETLEELKNYELVKLGILVFKSWRKSIKKLIGDNECQFRMSLNDGYLTMRVYLIREGEDWFDDDLEGYKEEAVAIF